MIERTDINHVLMQMRTLRSQMDAQVLQPQKMMVNNLENLKPEKLQENSTPNFSTMLKQAVDSVNETQMEAGKLAKSYELGEKDVDITDVMIGLQKANVSFQAMTQVRNKLVTAYQDIMNMPI